MESHEIHVPNHQPAYNQWPLQKETPTTTGSRGRVDPWNLLFTPVAGVPIGLRQCFTSFN